MINQEEATPETMTLGRSNPLKDAEKDLSDKLKPEHRSSRGEQSTGLILNDAKNTHHQSKVFFAYVSLLNMPTAIASYQLRGLEVRYYATGVSYGSFQEAIRIFRRTRNVDEVKDYLTLPPQEQDKQKYRGVR